MVLWPSGKAKVCKTFIHQFKSGQHLHMERWLSWSKAHDWKSCVGHKPTEGSNPSLSAKKAVSFDLQLFFCAKMMRNNTTHPRGQDLSLPSGVCCHYQSVGSWMNYRLEGFVLCIV